MSAAAAGSQLAQEIGLYESSLGKKAVMAVTGVILFGFVLGHMLGNLQIYLGAEQINAYGALLHSKPGLLWVVRLVLLTAVGLHMISALQLWLQARAARPDRYVRKGFVQATYASRTMIWSGPIIAAFVVYHLLHFTTLSLHPDPRLIDGIPDVYHNVVTGFQQPLAAGFYIVAMVLLCLHLYHGVWSMFQTLGVNHPKYTPLLKSFAKVFAFVIAIGNISIPVSVLTGLIR